MKEIIAFVTFVHLFLLSIPGGYANMPECDSNSLVITSGTYFSECVGYCESELRIDRNEIVYSQPSSTDSPLPDKRKSRATTKEEWNHLVNLANVQIFQSLEQIYGCPYCYDQGAEWIAIRCDDFVKRITVSYGAPLEPIHALLTRIRKIRKGFE